MEIKYVKCIISKTNGFTIGKIYNWPNPVDDNGTIRQVSTLSGSLWSFETSTEKAYEAQTKAEIITTDYIPKIGDYVIMENAGGWGYHPANNGCLAVITDVSTRRISGIKKDLTVYSISGTLINSIKSLPVKFADIPQLDSSEKVVFRQALPHEISNTTPKTESLTKEKGEFHLELERRTQYPITPENAFPVKALRKQLKIVNFQSVHEIKIVEEKLLKKTKSKLFNI